MTQNVRAESSTSETRFGICRRESHCLLLLLADGKSLREMGYYDERQTVQRFHGQFMEPLSSSHILKVKRRVALKKV